MVYPCLLSLDKYPQWQANKAGFLTGKFGGWEGYHPGHSSRSQRGLQELQLEGLLTGAAAAAIVGEPPCCWKPQETLTAKHGVSWARNSQPAQWI